MSAAIVNLHEAKSSLSRSVERTAVGEEIIIAKAGKPKARLVPLAGKIEVRRPGGWEGKVWVTGDFDEPLPAESSARSRVKTDPWWTSCSSTRTLHLVAGEQLAAGQ